MEGHPSYPAGLSPCIANLRNSSHTQLHQTCHRLHNATLARPVWLSLVQWYSATIQPRPFIPEKPLNLYTNRELEHLVLNGQRGRAVCGLAQSKERTSPIYPQSAHLVEGGRWLLFGMRDGSVKYHDLNASGKTSEAVTLVPTVFDEGARTITMLSVDMDPDAEYVMFNLGIMTWAPPEDQPDHSNLPLFDRWIEVYRVTPHWDENGQAEGLQAERLARFREAYMYGCSSFTLRGCHVAYSLYSLPPIVTSNGQNIVIVDWTSADSDSTSLAYSRRVVRRCRVEVSCLFYSSQAPRFDEPQWLALLPDDRLLCYNGYEILLFDLTNVPMTKFLPTNPNHLPRQPAVASLQLYASAISPPYFVHDSIRFSLVTREGITGLIVPRSRSLAARTMDHVNLFSVPNFCNSSYVGYDRAILHCFPNPIILRYVWPEQHSSFHISPKSTIQTLYCSLDNSSNRALVLTHQVL